MTTEIRTVDCPACGKTLLPVRGPHGAFLGCPSWPACFATAPCDPYGNAAGPPTSYDGTRARQLAHRAFDQLWQSRLVTRDQAYAWLRSTMGLSPREGHIRLLSVRQCERLIRKANDYYDRLARRAGRDGTT